MTEYIRAYCERSAVTESGPIPFTVSTEQRARDGRVIEAAAWRLDNYRKNPVVLWVHDYMGQHLPIGRANVLVADNALRAEIDFDQQDEFARQIESKYRRGYLNAVSVGWDEPELSNDPARVKAADLLDISAVPVPADPDALIERQMRAFGDLGRELLTLGNDGDAWPETAAAMVELYLDRSRTSERERRSTYNRLARLYRLAGKTAPEYLPLRDLQPLGEEELRGLFLEGEADMHAALFVRAGKVLSARNLGDLKQAMELIQGVIDRAQKESEQTQDGEPERVADDVAQRLLDAIKLR